MKRFQKILVAAPVDRTGDTANWLDNVARSAHPREVDWRIVVEQPPLLPGSAEPSWSPEEDAAPAAAELRAHGWPADFDLRIEVAVEPTDTTLLAALGGGDYDLVVVPCGDPGFRPLAEKLGRKAPCSVLVLPAGCCGRPTGVQVAIDLSDFSKAALEVGAAFARGLGVRQPRALHAWWLSERHIRTAIPYQEVRALVQDSAGRQAADFVAEHAPDDLPWATELLEAPLACSGILAASRRRPDELLVLAHRGKNALAEALLGGTAAEVIRGVECPCLVVKRKGAGMQLLRDLLGRLRSEQPA